MFDTKKVEIERGGQTLTLETGRVARQADGAVLARLGDTVVLCAVTAAKNVKPGQDFFPLTVHYQEKFSAAGRIPGGFFKRERGATEKETLTSRLIDRPIRPLFPEGFYNEINVIAHVLSYDGENEPDVLAMVAASAALTISGVPFMGPIGAARVGYQGGEYILNPTQEQIKEGELDLMVAATHNAVMMVESEAKELSEEVMLGAIMFAHRASQQVINAIIDLAEQSAKDPWELDMGADHSALKQQLRDLIGFDIGVAYKTLEKGSRREQLDAAREKAKAAFADADPDGRPEARQEARSRDRAHRHPQGRQAHRRPRHQDGAPDRIHGWLPAAHPRLVALHPRRDASDLHDHLGHQGLRADDRWSGGSLLPELHAAL
jgi:polyribonucleotide nucleotidyltransferase